MPGGDKVAGRPRGDSPFLREAATDHVFAVSMGQTPLAIGRSTCCHEYLFAWTRTRQQGSVLFR